MITITVAYATPEKQWEIPIKVENNCTVALAIRRSGILEMCPEIHLSRSKVGIYGRIVTLDAGLASEDRVEIYRPLKIDPKVGRLQRAAHQKKS